jgi:hypothetical protein
MLKLEHHILDQIKTWLYCTQFLEQYVEYENYINYGFFRFIFKDCNIGFGYPRAHICCSCEEMNVKIEGLNKSENSQNLQNMKILLKEHQNEANYF